ncbi:GIY-YIG nuclease family protein [Endozoicomonas sp. GU-1]|uniref:GIY-YIG nuclease family protein n=1 Tax=Endozoicomonas sp. GU-1 TaxID=3009078 RepID=UPI0022B2D8EC|nr:GIY-YIG nuclease family protein [Endozoicomonas sp. GU-1]WBA83051.1 GIY-YIG nuclease family protein [Endozoicomonas sp. GU-1]WBA85973.1 GIY-YIG nuclease family protein [Endozoicomonas sp. GU-1]
MIIFTVTNKTTSQVYVGSTRNDLVDQWEKMVAAAEQNLDYPLYQEIRVHGRDSFVVEEWDFVDDRNELNALEQEAIETLNARSLRGYRTSTVKIQPKKKTRTRKSSLEKELASIFDEFDGDMDDFDEISPEPKKQTEEKTATPQQPAIAQPVTPVSVERVRSPDIKLDVATAQENAAEARKEKPVAKPENGSQVNAVVQMNNICLSDDISAQLEAIQAAANAVLSGDSNAVELLNSKPAAPAPVKIEVVELLPEPVKAAEPEIIIELDPREQRIREAIERHRKARAQKTSDSQASDRQQIEQLLAELTTRAMGMNSQSVAVAA